MKRNSDVAQGFNLSLSAFRTDGDKLAKSLRICQEKSTPRAFVPHG